MSQRCLHEHTIQRLSLVKQKEERQWRIDQRRQVAEIQQEASNGVKFAKQAAEWERKATTATKQFGIIMEAAKQAEELAEAA